LFLILLSIYLIFQNREIQKLNAEQNSLAEKISKNDDLKIWLTDTLENHPNFERFNNADTIIELPIRRSEINKLIDSLKNIKERLIQAGSVEKHIEHVKEDSTVIAYINQLNRPLVKKEILLFDKTIARIDNIINVLILASAVYLVGIGRILMLKKMKSV